MFDSLNEEVAVVWEKTVYAAFYNACSISDVGSERLLVSLFHKYSPCGMKNIGDPPFGRQTVHLPPNA